MAAAGVRGARDVFGAQRVELDVAQPHGRPRRYAAAASGDVAEIDPAAPVRHPAGPVVVRTMTVGGAAVGELTVWLASRVVPGGPRRAGSVRVRRRARRRAARRRHPSAAGRAAAPAPRTTRCTTRSPAWPTGPRCSPRATRCCAGSTSDHPVALLLLDINGFKEVNGTLGHGAGDQLLKVVGARLTDLTREHELLARLGDDEFALLLPHLPVLSDSANPLTEAPSPVPHVMRRARELVEQLAPADRHRRGPPGHRGRGRCHRGQGRLRRPGRADPPRRDRHGPGEGVRGVSVATYDSSHDATSTDHLALLAELREALEADDQLVLALQPAVDLVTGAPTGVEALIRWQHPRRGMLPPVEFIRTIEHSELLGPFTRYVLDHALAAAADWCAAGMDLPVSVNVSARSLLDATLPGAGRRRAAPAPDAAAPAGPGDHRDGGGQRTGDRRRGACRACVTSASSSPWTTSAPATRR